MITRDSDVSVLQANRDHLLLLRDTGHYLECNSVIGSLVLPSFSVISQNISLATALVAFILLC